MSFSLMVFLLNHLDDQHANVILSHRDHAFTDLHVKVLQTSVAKDASEY